MKKEVSYETTDHNRSTVQEYRLVAIAARRLGGVATAKMKAFAVFVPFMSWRGGNGFLGQPVPLPSSRWQSPPRHAVAPTTASPVKTMFEMTASDDPPPSSSTSSATSSTLETVRGLSEQVAKLRDVIVAVREVRAAGRAPSSEKNAANTSPVGTPSSREEAGVSLQKEESLPPDASSKPKKNRNTPLVWAGKPSQEFIAASSTRHLEREPYWEMSELPMHTFKAKEPYVGAVESVEKLVQPGAPGEVFHVKLRHDGNMPYWEGQSIGVTPPGVDKNGKPHKVRLYSIASTRYGDDGEGRTVSLCIRRATYRDPETGKEDPAKEGVCSNFLCRAQGGQEVTLTGPSGKIMLLPEETPDADVIMVGTGTGIAPYRGFLRRLFVEDTPAARAFTGVAWLFLGVPTSEGLLYHDDWMEILRKFPFNFRYDLAISREQKNATGGKMYIQDRMEQYAGEIFEKLDNGAHIYFCGLKGMMPGINDMLARVSSERGISWDDKLKELKGNGQWHVEVY